MDFSWSKLPVFKQFFLKRGRNTNFTSGSFDSTGFDTSNPTMQSIWYGYSYFYALE
jgi:hypothetical protein